MERHGRVRRMQPMTTTGGHLVGAAFQTDLPTMALASRHVLQVNEHVQVSLRDDVPPLRRQGEQMWSSHASPPHAK